jgi:C4-dicarboxylate transporter DctM subunit
MTPTVIGLVGIAVLLLLFALRVPIAFAMALVGFLGFAYLCGVKAALGIIGTVPFRTVAHYGISVIPLFILMGLFIFYAGVSREIFSAAYEWLGWLPGGLAIATITACASFAAGCGSSPATAATMGAVALPEMRRYGYDNALATGSVAAGGTLGILIPPSVLLILYGIMTEQSIGKLFISGILPGILLTALMICAIYIKVRGNPYLGPPGPRTNFKQKLVILKGIWPILILFSLVMGGLYLGLFTPAEGGGIGACGAFLIMLIKRKLTWQNFSQALMDTGKTTAMVFAIVIGAMIFGYFLAVTKIPMNLADFVAEMPVPRYVTLGIILFVYLILGCVMDALAMILVTIPIFFPLVVALGFDPIWFGVIMVIVAEMGLITPPVGVNVFIIAGVAKDVPLFVIFRGIFPFFIAMVVCLIILVFFPQIALFLPNLMK